MTSRESVPNASALEQIEAPSKEVAEAARRAAESEASDKPALKDAVETLARLADPRVVGATRVPTILGVGEPEVRAAKREKGGTNKLPKEPRGELHTSPSLERVLAGNDRDADTLVDDASETLPEEPAEQPTPQRSRTTLLIAAGIGLAFLLMLGMLAIALWSEGSATNASASAQGSAATTGPPRATQTAPVIAIATATVEPPVPSVAVSAEPVRSGTAKASSKASAKSATAAEPSSKPAPAVTSSAKAQGTNWVPGDS